MGWPAGDGRGVLTIWQPKNNLEMIKVWMDYTTETHTRTRTHSFTLFRSGFIANLLKVVRGLLGLYFFVLKLQVFFVCFLGGFTCARSKNDLYLKLCVRCLCICVRMCGCLPVICISGQEDKWCFRACGSYLACEPPGCVWMLVCLCVYYSVRERGCVQ